MIVYCKPKICWKSIYDSLAHKNVKVGNVDIARTEINNILGCGNDPVSQVGVGALRPYCRVNPYIPVTSPPSCPACANQLPEVCKGQLVTAI